MQFNIEGPLAAKPLYEVPTPAPPAPQFASPADHPANARAASPEAE